MPIPRSRTSENRNPPAHGGRGARVAPRPPAGWWCSMDRARSPARYNAERQRGPVGRFVQRPRDENSRPIRGDRLRAAQDVRRFAQPSEGDERVARADQRIEVLRLRCENRSIDVNSGMLGLPQFLAHARDPHARSISSGLPRRGPGTPATPRRTRRSWRAVRPRPAGRSPDSAPKPSEQHRDKSWRADFAHAGHNLFVKRHVSLFDRNSSFLTGFSQVSRRFWI